MKFLFLSHKFLYPHIKCHPLLLDKKSLFCLNIWPEAYYSLREWLTIDELGAWLCNASYVNEHACLYNIATIICDISMADHWVLLGLGIYNLNILVYLTEILRIQTFYFWKYIAINIMAKVSLTQFLFAVMWSIPKLYCCESSIRGKKIVGKAPWRRDF